MMRLELVKVWRSYRMQLAALCGGVFLGLMLLGFYTYAHNETGGAAEFRYTFENRSYFNGLTFALHAFYFGFVLVLPIFAVSEAGVQLAGETASGTLLLLLTRPVSRSRLFVLKLGVTAGVAAVLVLGLWAASLATGLCFIGWGDLDLYPGVLQMTDRHQHLSQRDALGRFAAVLPAATLALWVPAALGMLLSAWARSPVNAIGTSMALYVVSYVIAEVHFFKELRPWLFTSYMAFWREFFQERIDWLVVCRDAARLAGFALLFTALAVRRFRTREEA